MLRTFAMLLPVALAIPLGSCARRPAPAGTAAAARHFPSDDSLRARLATLVERGVAPGIVLGALEPDGSRRVVWHGSAGAGARPLGPRTVFELGSITKVFTATLLAEMVAAGNVGVDDPVARLLPPGTRVPARHGREITLHDLVTHHSGLPSLPGNMRPADRLNPSADYTPALLYEFLGGHELRRDPGAQFEYSNVGFGLLGHALANAGGGTYAEVIQRRVLDPLGMRMTGATNRGEMAAWMAEGHDAQGRVVRRLDVADGMAGAGALRSSAEDMLRFLAANVGPPRSRLQRAMRTTHVRQRDVNAQLGVGLAWQVRAAGDRTIVAHSGGSTAFRAFIAFDPERRAGVVLLANAATDNAPLNQLALELVAPAAPAANVSR